ncbi:MAG: TIGR03118 family protein, partial [Actinomycetota bacterium]
MRRLVTSLVVPAVLFLFAAPAAAQTRADTGPNAYEVTNLVSDQTGVAAHQDPNLVNAWGLVAGPTTPWWVADNGTDLSTLYDGTGTAIPLVVSVAGAPTGAVFNGSSDFVVSHRGDSGPSLFLFATEGGTIRGWNPAVPNLGPTAKSTKTFTLVDRSGAGAIYKGLAIATTVAGPRLYATDFHNGRVDVFDGSLRRIVRSGAFVDPNLPDGFAPFGIQAIGSSIYVTYAKQDAAAEDDVAGAGLGFVDRYNKWGRFLGRVAGRGALDAPWGLAWAPQGFGRFGGDLLVGNFGDGRITAFRMDADGSFTREGQLRMSNGD